MVLAEEFAQPIVRIGNAWYFAFIAFLILVSVGSVFLCRKLGQKFTHRFILIVLFANFGLHFLKQFLPYYMAHWPYTLTDSLFPNLCAVLIFFAPFIYLSKNAYLKDYFYYMGIISGIAVYLIPTGAMRVDLLNTEYYWELARFYFCHWPLVVCPLVMVDQKLHKLNWKRAWFLPLAFTAVEAIIAGHCILFGPILHVPGFATDWIGEHGVLNRFALESSLTNQSMQFGPQPSFDGVLGAIYPYLIPYLMTYRVDGQLYFTPVIWVTPFLYLATLISVPLMTLPFEHAQMKQDLLDWKEKLRSRKVGTSNDD